MTCGLASQPTEDLCVRSVLCSWLSMALVDPVLSWNPAVNQQVALVLSSATIWEKELNIVTRMMP